MALVECRECGKPVASDEDLPAMRRRARPNQEIFDL
jgi:endogenous inhibitor of DNA gyrase (YacG/DUF329 family)